ncbi:MAG TPA: MBL fold metallo-hydrolase [Epsilonproteobacteria bacterium]|nr:MBL fold metallo-hydrolase [Campylobacterota bacterium]
MKIFITILLILSSVFGFEYNLKPKKITGDVYCFFGKLENINKQNAGNIVNSCFVQTKEGFVVIDSGPTYDYASQAYVQMQKIAKLPVKYVIITHDHDDHWQGNSFYKSKGALLIGPRTYEQNVVVGTETRMQRILGKELYGKTKIVKLDTIVDGNVSMTVGNEIFEIKQLEPIAHTKGDLIVYLPRSKVLFVGDLVFNGRLTSLRDGSILGSLDALKKIDAYHAKVIIGGHGYQTDTNATHSLKAYLTEMKKEILDAQDHDIGMEEITKMIVMPAYQEMKLYDVLHKRTVLDAYKELEMMEDEE